jgi:hypothetical protein
MIGIIYAHILYDGKAIIKINRYKSKIISSHTYTFWYNNTHSLISGVIGYKSIKYCNLLYLWFCVVFYSVGIPSYFIKYNKLTSLKGQLCQQ